MTSGAAACHSDRAYEFVLAVWGLCSCAWEPDTRQRPSLPARATPLYAPSPPAHQELYDEAKKDGWVVVSMKNDWKRIFGFENVR